MFRSVVVEGCVCELRKGRRRHHTWPSWMLARHMTSVWREGLWCKIKHYGVDNFFFFCEGLYSGVVTRVVMNRVKLRWFGIERGIRQGCPLPLLLFNI